MMNCLKSFFVICFIFFASPSHAELLGKEWVSESEMKKQSAFARQNNLLLKSLRCKFNEAVKSPGRSDVLFSAEFERPSIPQAWGWTFEANAPLKGPEQQAKAAGFEVASEEYFEVTGVTWVRCKVWRRM